MAARAHVQWCHKMQEQCLVAVAVGVSDGRLLMLLVAAVVEAAQGAVAVEHLLVGTQGPHSFLRQPSCKATHFLLVGHLSYRSSVWIVVATVVTVVDVAVVVVVVDGDDLHDQLHHG